MNKVVEVVIIDDIDNENLEGAWYKYQALLDLIQSGNTDNLILARYEKAYQSYNKLWNEILTKYFEKDYANLGGYNWSASFNTKEITITQ